MTGPEPTDSTKLLRNMLKVAARVKRVLAAGGQPSEHDAGVLAFGIEELDQWLEKGGDLPDQWNPCFDCGPELSLNGRCQRHGQLVPKRRPAYVPPLER